MKVCVNCGEEKDLTHFDNLARNRDGKRKVCKTCVHSAASRRSSRSDHDRARDRAYVIRIRYGLSPERHAQMRLEQDNKCAICRSPGKLCVDHCHETNRVRGLLCDCCNRALGLVRENPQTLLRMMAYIKQHTAVNNEEDLPLAA
jgi:protein-arginine kinase activator protein McsA